MKDLGYRLSVHGHLAALLPNGTASKPRRTTEKTVPRTCHELPFWPPDVFAVAASLLQETGIYQSIIANRGPAAHAGPALVVSSEDRQTWTELGVQWSKSDEAPPAIHALWREMIAASAACAMRVSPTDGAIPAWARPALALLVIADEACNGVGTQLEEAAAGSWIVQVFQLTESLARRALPAGASGDRKLHTSRHISTLGYQVSRDVLAVQPKVRTPQVGATVRSLSHNLAILPTPRRLAASLRRLRRDAGPSNADPLNLLAIPFPFCIPRTAFSSDPVEDTAPKWGWFELAQTWLAPGPGRIAAWVCSLIRRAPGDVHGVVFPEYALDWETHAAIVTAVAKNCPTVEFIVSGSSSDCNGATGNFELTTSLWNNSTTPRDEPTFVSTSRPKHHRWRIDTRQVGDYQLGTQLAPDTAWWESIIVPRRRVQSHVFRAESTFTVLICEDLARADPVHQMVRSLGPNLVFCLLMDGPQIASRWPGRHALSLSEDPGSSVMTLTSRGLIALSNERYGPGGSWSVGLCKDPDGDIQQLDCPPGSSAVLIPLTAQPVHERTLDGRLNPTTYQWVFGKAVPVPVDPAEPIECP